MTFISTEKDPEKQGVGVSTENGKVVDITQRKRRDKVAELLESIDTYVSDFVNASMEYFALGKKTMTIEKKKEYTDAYTLLGTLFSEMKTDPLFFAGIYNAPIESLANEDRFIKTLLVFLIDTEENSNIENMEEYLAKLSVSNAEGEPAYVPLYKHLKRVLESTEYLLRQGMLSVCMDFDEIADVLSKSSTETNEVK